MKKSTHRDPMMDIKYLGKVVSVLLKNDCQLTGKLLYKEDYNSYAIESSNAATSWLFRKTHIKKITLA